MTRHPPARLLRIAVAVTVALPAMYPVSVSPAYGAEVNARFEGIEMIWNGLHEEAAQVSTPEPPYETTTAKVWLRVLTPKRFKLVIYSQAQNFNLAETVMTVSSPGVYFWEPTIAVTNVARSYGAYAYYWNGTAYVQDDVAYGWLPIHYQEDVGYVGRWGPNQYSLPSNSRSGDFATVTQYFWWWDNSLFSSHTVGSDNMSRLDGWATGPDQPWLLTIEFRRISRPVNAGSPSPVSVDGWNFHIVTCGIFGCSQSGVHDWDSDIPSLRPGDVEEAQLGGDEEAQFELDDEDVHELLVVEAREPDLQYGNMHHLRVWFYRRPGYEGDPFYLLTEMELQTLPIPSVEDRDFLQHLRTGF